MSTSAQFTPPPCPGQPMTRAQVVALRDAGELREGCHYVVSDWTQGTTLPGPNLVELHATAPGQLSMGAKVTTPYDNVAWAGRYDIDQGPAGTMHALVDNLGNNVRDSVDGSTLGQFPWGLANITQNDIEDSVLTGWAGITTVVNNNVFRRATIDLSGNWDQVVGNTATSATTAPATWPVITLAGGSGARSFNGNVLRDGASFRSLAGGTGTRTITDNEFLDGYALDIAATATTAVTIDGNRFTGHNNTPDALISGGGTRSLTRSTFVPPGGFLNQQLTLTAAAGTVTIDRSTLTGRAVQNAATAANLSITGGSQVNGLIQQNAGATGGALAVQSTILSSNTATITQSGTGAITLTTCILGNFFVNTNASTTRGVTIINTQAVNGTVTQARTGGTGVDTITGSYLAFPGGGTSVINLLGATDPGGNQTVVDRCTIGSGGSLALTNPTGTVSRTDIATGATVTGTGTGNVDACRFAAGATVNLGAFAHNNTVIEGLFAKTLTGPNSNRLCSKAFDDVVGV